MHSLLQFKKKEQILLNLTLYVLYLKKKKKATLFAIPK